jgi:hypothetical protein
MLLLSLTLVLPAAAQDSTVFCGNLAAADCELLTANAEASKGLDSAAVAITGEINVLGVPDTDDINITLSGTGAYSVDRAAIDALAASMTPGETPDTAAMVNALLSAIKGVDAELTLNVNLPEAVASQANLPVSTITLDAKLVDGIGYINFDELDKVVGGMLAQQNLTGWGGVNFAEVGEQFVAQNAAMLEQMGAQMGAAGSTAAMMDPAQYEFVTQYLQVSRTDAGGGDAEFTFGLDFAGLMADPQFMEIMKTQMQAQGTTMTDAQLQQMMPMMSMFTQGLTFNVVTRINPDSKQTTHTGLVFKYDLTSVMAMSGQTPEGQSEISLNLNFDYTGHNATSVAAPAGAQVAPTEMVLQMLMGGMGGASR